VANVNVHRSRHQFMSMVFTQVLVTSFFTLQWIGMYIYYAATMYNNRSVEQWAIHYFLFFLTNTLYYINNVKSFYLSTLTSRLFRQIFIKALLKLIRKSAQQQRNTTRVPALMKVAS
jgi:hypothetical protein